MNNSIHKEHIQNHAGDSWYTVREISAMLKMHEETIRRAIRQGRLESSKFGRDHRVSQASLESYIQSKNYKPQSQSEQKIPSSVSRAEKGSAEAVLEVFGKWVGDDSEEILDLIRVYRDRKMKPDIQKILVELRQCFEDIYGERLVNIILFGSQARGDATSESDIDVMVILKGPVNPSEEINRISETRAEISLKNDVVISCIFMSAERYTIEQSPLILNVHREGTAVCGAAS